MDHWLLRKLADYGSAIALADGAQFVTYRQLCDRARAWANSLNEWHIPPGACVALCGDFSPDSCSLLLALLARHSIAVPLRKLHAATLDIAAAEAVVSFDRAGDWHFQRRHPDEIPPLLGRLRWQGEPGLVLFTSGTTGTSKALLWNFERFLDKFRTAGRRATTLAFLHLDHIGGLNTLFHVLASGGTLVTTPDRDPETVCEAIERHQVELLPTTPTFLNMLLISDAHRRYDLASLHTITYGTEPMPAGTLRGLVEALPDVRLKQTYGLSEIGILRSQSSATDSLWLKVGGPDCRIKVIDGVLWVRPESAMLGYLNAPSPFAADGWLKTHDAVETDGDYLRILGRTSDIINVGGEKVYPAEVESVLQQVQNIASASVHGRNNPISGQVVVARVVVCEPEDERAVTNRIRHFCRNRLAPHQMPMLVQVTQEPIPTENVKKDRALLSEQP